jgi:hypothetical protein
MHGLSPSEATVASKAKHEQVAALLYMGLPTDDLSSVGLFFYICKMLLEDGKDLKVVRLEAKR